MVGFKGIIILLVASEWEYPRRGAEGAEDKKKEILSAICAALREKNEFLCQVETSRLGIYGSYIPSFLYYVEPAFLGQAEADEDVGLRWVKSYIPARRVLRAGNQDP